MTRDRTGELLDDEPVHHCDRGWVEATDGRVRRCSACAPALVSEAAWQSRVVDYAKFCGWRLYWHADSRRSVAGWPDLTLIRGTALLFAELKTDTGRLKAAQTECLDALRAVPAVWRPSDWPTVQKLLR